MRFTGLYASLLFCLLALSGCKGQETEAERAVQQWLSQNATPVHVTDNGSKSDDLDAIADFIGDARLVCLGESRHDIREQCLFKTRLVKSLGGLLKPASVVLAGCLGLYALIRFVLF